MRAKYTAAIAAAQLLLQTTICVPVCAQSAEADVAAFARAWDGVASYSTRVTLFERKGENVQNIVMDYEFRKPSSFTVHVIDGPNKGVILNWNGGTTVYATRGRGLFGNLFKKKFSLHDPSITTIRGSSFDELSYGAILTHIKNTPGTLSEGAEESIGDIAAQSISLTPQNSSLDAGFTREVIDISTATHFPVRVQGYDGTTLVRQIVFSDIKIKGK